MLRATSFQPLDRRYILDNVCQMNENDLSASFDIFKENNANVANKNVSNRLHKSRHSLQPVAGQKMMFSGRRTASMNFESSAVFQEQDDVNVCDNFSVEESEAPLRKCSSVKSLLINSKNSFMKRRKSSPLSLSSESPMRSRASSVLSLNFSFGKREAEVPVYKNYERKLKKRHSIESSNPTNFRSIGTLLRLNADGTRVVRLTRPPHGPYGFYIAKGGIEFNYGIIVSRLSDSYPHSFFTGLLEIGDQILRIDDYKVDHRCTLDQAYDLMTSTTDYLTMTILPFVLRRLSELIEEEETTSLHSSSSESNNSIDVKTNVQGAEEPSFVSNLNYEDDDVVLNF